MMESSGAGGGGGRRRPTLLQQMSVIDPSNLRNLLRMRDEDEDRRDSALARLTLGAVLGCKENRSASIPAISNRSLLEIIRDEESDGEFRGFFSSTDNRNSWESLKHRIRIGRTGDYTSTIQISRPNQPTGNLVSVTLAEAIVATTSSENGAGDSIPSIIQPENASNSQENIVTEFNAGMNVREPVITRLSAALAAEREQQRQQQQQQQQEQQQQRQQQQQQQQEEENGLNLDAVMEIEEESILTSMPSPGDAAMAVTSVGNRVSLMTLLEETDRQIGVFVGVNEEVKEEEDKEGKGGENGIEGCLCCVCMVRHKGAAFIPCGHTFCRLCSRELWVNRGNCPLCNGSILEILDIF